MSSSVRRCYRDATGCHLTQCSLIGCAKTLREREAVGIVRTVEWKLTCSPAEADARFRQAFAHLNLNPEGPPGSIHGALR